MNTPDRRWVKIAESEKEISLGANNIVEIEADGRIICIGKFNDQLFAFNNKCPHASAPFIQSYIDAKGNVVCPLHRYKFCISNGRNVSGEGYFLRHWPVEVRENGVFVGFEKNKLFGLI